MKSFRSIAFDLEQYKDELKEYEAFLQLSGELSERKAILPFFRQHLQLTSHLATLLIPEIADCYAFEFELFGDFCCDLVLANQRTQDVVFIEFEDAKRNSIFRQKTGKYQPEYSTRFEHGYSQLIDWFYLLHDQQRTHAMKQRFLGKSEINYHGLLIIGREQFLNESQTQRLNWRVQKTRVDSHTIACLTFDEVYKVLDRRLNYFQQIHQTK